MYLLQGLRIICGVVGSNIEWQIRPRGSRPEGPWGSDRGAFRTQIIEGKAQNFAQLVVQGSHGWFPADIYKRAGDLAQCARNTPLSRTTNLIVTEQPTPALSCTSVPCLSHPQAQLRIVRCVRAIP